MKEHENKVEEIATEEIITRPYTLRKLRDGDLVPLLGLLRKLGLKEFKDTLLTATNGGSVQEVGMNVLLNMAEVIISRLEGDVGEEIYGFYSELSGIPVSEIQGMEIGTLPLMVYDSMTEIKNCSFFKVLAKLL